MALNMSAIGSTIPAGCWEFDLATGALMLCPQSRRMFGLNPDSSEVLRESEWVDRLHPDDLPVLRESITASLEHQTPYAERFRTTHADGRVGLVFGIGGPLDRGGKRGRFVGWNFDLTSAGEMAAEWIAAHPEALRQEHSFSITPSTAADGSTDKGGAETLLERAHSILRVRRSRERLFGRAMIGEPAFDLLLCLYVQSGQCENSLSALAKRERIPYSSALRWLGYLADKGLVERSETNSDRRTTPVRLTASGRELMDELLTVR